MDSSLPLNQHPSLLEGQLYPHLESVREVDQRRRVTGAWESGDARTTCWVFRMRSTSLWPARPSMVPETHKSAIRIERQLSIRGESINHDPRSHGDFNSSGLSLLADERFEG